MPIFHRALPDDLPPSALAHEVRRQMNIVMLVATFVLMFLTLVTIATLVIVLAQTNNERLISERNSRSLKILKDYTTGPPAQAAQHQTQGLVQAIIVQGQCNTRRAIAHLPPTPDGQPCVDPPGN